MTRTVHNTEFDFTVDTNIANYIEYGSYHSYTFEVNRTIDNGLIENLLLSLQQDGTYRAFLIAYDLTEDEKEQAQNGIDIDVTGKISAVVFADQDWVNTSFQARVDTGGNGSGCVEFVTTTTHYCDDADGDRIIDNGQVDGSGCHGNRTTETVTNLIVDLNCLSGGGSGPGPGTGGPEPGTGPGNGDTGGGSSGGGGGSNGNPNDDCVPSIDNPCNDDMTALLIGGQNEKTTDQKNCEELNKMTSPPGYSAPNPFTDDSHPLNSDGLNTTPRQAILSLNDNEILNYGFETGFSLRNSGQFPTFGSYAQNISADGLSHHINYTLFPTQYGTVHVHPINTSQNTWIPMFSLDDIYSVLQIRNMYSSVDYLNNSNTNGDNLFTSILVTQQSGMTQTYAIKIDDIIKFRKLQNVRKNKRQWDILNEELRNKYIAEANNTEGSPAEYQKTLLEFLNENNLGVSLYQMQQINAGSPDVEETWTKLSLGPTNNINQTPCG